MQWPAKAGIVVVCTTLVLAVVSPLAVFFIELVANPESFLTLSVADQKVDSATGTATLTLTLRYGGTVPLKDFTLSVLGRTVKLGDVGRGERSVQLALSAEDLQRVSNLDIAMSFKIAGIYGLKIYVGGITR